MILGQIDHSALFGFDLFYMGLRVVVGGRSPFALAGAPAPATARDTGSALLPRSSQSSLSPFQVFFRLLNCRQRFLRLAEFLLCLPDCV